MLDFLPGEEVHRPQNRSILLKNQDDQRAGMADASTSIWKENRESVGKGVSALMGGWLIWLLLGGLFLFLMLRGGGCCGGHGGHGGNARDSHGPGNDDTDPPVEH